MTRQVRNAVNFDAVHEVEPGKGGELQLSDAIGPSFRTFLAELVEREKLF